MGAFMCSLVTVISEGSGLRYPVPPLTKEVSCTLLSSVRKSCGKAQLADFLRKSHLGAGGDGIPAWESIKQLREESDKLQNIHRASEHKTH